MSESGTLPRYSRCFVCGEDNLHGLGLTFSYWDSCVWASIAFAPSYVSYENRIHGGVISGLLDEAMGWSCYLQDKLFFYTVELSMRYLVPVAAQREVRVEARMTQLQRGRAFAEATLVYTDQPDTLLVKAQGKFLQASSDDQKAIQGILD